MSRGTFDMPCRALTTNTYTPWYVPPGAPCQVVRSGTGFRLMIKTK